MVIREHHKLKDLLNLHTIIIYDKNRFKTACTHFQKNKIVCPSPGLCGGNKSLSAVSVEVIIHHNLVSIVQL